MLESHQQDAADRAEEARRRARKALLEKSVKWNELSWRQKLRDLEKERERQRE